MARSEEVNGIAIRREEWRDDLSSWRGVWIFAEQRDGAAAGVTLELLGAGRSLAEKLGTPLSAVLMGSGIGETAGALIARGADVVYRIDHPSLALVNDEAYTDLLDQLIRKYRPEIVLIGATAHGRSLAPRIASRLDTGLTADCIGLDIDPDKRVVLQTRPAFGGNLLATIICPDRRPQMCTVLPKAMKPLEPDPSRTGTIIDADVAVPLETSVRVLKAAQTLSTQIDLSQAEIIVSAGRGIGKRENIRIIQDLAAVLGGVVGASRPVVEAGWTDPGRQIGQTGKTVSPKVYFACGISGAVQHLAGITAADRIVAINRDPDAPIFKVAHFGIVGDVLEVVPAMTREFRNRFGSSLRH